MKLVDGFIFNDELELLRLRLMEIGDYVDLFVLVEATHNWQKSPKPLFYETHKNSFAPWHDKIRHVVVKDMPLDQPFPACEHHQRNAIWRGFEDLDAEDLVLISDADEIPSRNALVHLAKHPPDTPTVLEQILHYYTVNCRQNQPWYGTIAMQRGYGYYKAQTIRDTRNHLPRLARGGWHFSWLGNVKDLQYKLACHTIEEDAITYGSEGIVPPDPGDEVFIQRCIKEGGDLFGRNFEYTKKEFIDIDDCAEDYPVSLEQWLMLYPELYRLPETVET